jgi:hypothetical protein
MSFFALPNRYLTRETRLMIHERKLEKTLRINVPLTKSVASVEALLHTSSTPSLSRTKASKTSFGAHR